MYGRLDGWLDCLMNGQKGEWMDRWMVIKMDTLMGGNKCLDGWMDNKTDGWLDIKIDGWTFE